MLKQLEIRSAGSALAVTHARESLVGVFPDLVVETSRGPLATAAPAITIESDRVIVPAGVWRAHAFDPLALDEAVASATRGGRHFALRVDEDPVARGDLGAMALQVTTRCQRHLDGRNRHSATRLFQDILVAHRSLHDRTKPLVAADFDHALDTWRWVLRLDGGASAALQVAALFHDIERLASESEVRVEQHASDYAAFKRAHAEAGAQMTAGALATVGAPSALVARVTALVAGHEAPADDPERLTLNEADALSFFSLNAPGFARHYGPAHTAKKVAYTLARLGPRGRRALATVRHRADIAALIARNGEGA